MDFFIEEDARMDYTGLFSEYYCLGEKGCVLVSFKFEKDVNICVLEPIETNLLSLGK